MKLDMLSNKFEGKLITFCGLNGSEKTKYIKLLTKWLEEKGYNVYVSSESTEFEIKNVVFSADYKTLTNDDHSSVDLLSVVDDIQKDNTIIAQKLKEGYIVINDRCLYTCLTNLIARGFKDEKLIHEISKTIIKPNISFFLNIPVEEASEVLKQSPDERETNIDLELQKTLHDLYIDFARENNGIIVSAILPENSCYERIIFEVIRGIKHKS